MSKLDSRLLPALWAVAVLFALPASAQHYTQTNLTADVSATSPTPVNPDANLVNAWGLTRSSTSPWWIADNGTGLSTLYNGTGVPQQLVVTIPLPDGASGTSAPTGTVFNYTSVFNVADGKKAIFLFATEDGTISGWNPTADATHSIIKVKEPKTAIFKGLAVADAAGGPRLYATNFMSGRVEVFNGNFYPVHTAEWAFRDPRLKKDFVPFGIQNIGGNLLVTFASRAKGSKDEDHGPGLGAAAIFDTDGRLLLRLEYGNWFNAPWGATASPADFGFFSHRILVGNFGDGNIHAFNAVTGKHEGALLDSTGNAIQIDGLWALQFGNDANAGPALKLFFTAGPGDENHGLFGNITPIASEQRGSTE